MALPSGPGFEMTVNFFGPLPVTLRGITCILSSTDRVSRRADMLATPAADFTAEGIVNVLILTNWYVALWGMPTQHSLGRWPPALLETFARCSPAFFGVRKIAASFCCHNGNGGVEHVNFAMAQMLVVVVNEHQIDWGAQLRCVELACNDSVSAATGLASNEVHIGKLSNASGSLDIRGSPTISSHIATWRPTVSNALAISSWWGHRGDVGGALDEFISPPP